MIMPSFACEFPEYPSNQGHFEQGAFVPDCKQCGACCMYVYHRITDEKLYAEEYALFDEYHGWKRQGKVLRLYSPCRMLEKVSETEYRCRVHKEKDRPFPCRRFGFGDYHHPPGCSFFGGSFDAEHYPDIPQEFSG